MPLPNWNVTIESEERKRIELDLIVSRFDLIFQHNKSNCHKSLQTMFLGFPFFCNFDRIVCIFFLFKSQSEESESLAVYACGILIEGKMLCLVMTWRWWKLLRWRKTESWALVIEKKTEKKLSSDSRGRLKKKCKKRFQNCSKRFDSLRSFKTQLKFESRKEVEF